MPVKMAIIKKVEITSIGEDVEKMCTFSYTVGENGSGCSHRGKWYSYFSKKKKIAALSCEPVIPLLGIYLKKILLGLGVLMNYSSFKAFLIHFHLLPLSKLIISSAFSCTSLVPWGTMYFLSAYYVPDTTVGTWVQLVMKMGKTLSSFSLHSRGDGDKKSKEQVKYIACGKD